MAQAKKPLASDRFEGWTDLSSHFHIRSPGDFVRRSKIHFPDTPCHVFAEVKMFCRSCGASLAEGAVKCGACGSPTNGSDRPDTPDAATTTPPVSPGGTGPSIPVGVKPPDYLIWSILSTLCCCPVTGVIAIVYSSQVQSKWNEGDQQGAVQASQTTMRWLIGGIVANLLANVIQAVFIYLTTGFGIFFKLI